MASQFGTKNSEYFQISDYRSFIWLIYDLCNKTAKRQFLERKIQRIRIKKSLMFPSFFYVWRYGFPPNHRSNGSTSPHSIGRRRRFGRRPHSPFWSFSNPNTSRVEQMGRPFLDVSVDGDLWGVIGVVAKRGGRNSK